MFSGMKKSKKGAMVKVQSFRHNSGPKRPNLNLNTERIETPQEAAPVLSDLTTKTPKELRGFFHQDNLITTGTASDSPIPSEGNSPVRKSLPRAPQCLEPYNLPSPSTDAYRGGSMESIGSVSNIMSYETTNTSTK
jgi:hypothetical protein